MAEEDARDDVSGPFTVVVVGLGMAYGVALSVGFVQYVADFDLRYQQNYWLGAGFVLAAAQCLLLLDLNWLKRVSNTLLGLWAALIFWWPSMPMRLGGLLLCTAAGFAVAGWHRRKLLGSEPGPSWPDVRQSLALGGWAVTAVVGVATAGAAYAALWLLIIKAVRTPDARPGVVMAIAAVAVLGMTAWLASRAMRTRRQIKARARHEEQRSADEPG